MAGLGDHCLGVVRPGLGAKRSVLILEIPRTSGQSRPLPAAAQRDNSLVSQVVRVACVPVLGKFRGDPVVEQRREKGRTRPVR
jgi:hypothetical protein